jgi:alpha-glucosidase (family GH31 glycosyl hydrolase)
MKFRWFYEALLLQMFFTMSVEAQTPYRFTCTDYVSTDANRAVQSAFSYDQDANRFSITSQGDCNVAFKLSDAVDGEYTIRQDQRWLVVSGINLSANPAKTQLWWLNGLNVGGWNPNYVATNKGQTVMLWNLDGTSSRRSPFDYTKPVVIIGGTTAEYLLSMGTTTSNRSMPGVITNVNFYAPYEVAATYPSLMGKMGYDSVSLTSAYRQRLTNVIREAEASSVDTAMVTGAKNVLTTASDTAFDDLQRAVDMLLMAMSPDDKPTTVSFSYAKTEDGLSAMLDSLNIKIQFFNDSTVRILKTYDADSCDVKSWVVLPDAKEQGVGIDYETTDSTVVMSTTKVRVAYHPATGKATFYRNDGAELLAERQCRMRPILDGDQPSYSVSQAFTLDKDERIYGLGQIQDGKLNERNQQLMLSHTNKSICIPYFQSSKSYGLYWDNYSPTRFSDNDEATLFHSTGRAIDYYVLVANNSAGVLRSVRHLTGEAKQPALWNFGFYQSKEHYTSANELMAVMRRYRDLRIPIDCVVQDWQYWGDNRHWNAQRFLAPSYANYQQMIDSVHAMHGKIMISSWPDFGPATEQALYLKRIGRLLPPESYPTGEDVHAYDAYDAGARDYYWSMFYDGLVSKGIDAYWLDSTEPDYYGDGGSDFDYVTGTGRTWRALHNVYPLAHIEGVYEHHREQEQLGDKRCSIMTRSGYMGMQRTGAYVWSADITAGWNILADQIAAACNLSVCGLPYWNSDTGGFFLGDFKGVNDDAYVRLFQRWTQFSTFTPMLRFHGAQTPREIWQFGASGDSMGVYDNLARYIRLRYHLLPYLYGTAHQVVVNGESFMNALPLMFEDDALCDNVKDEYMFGQSLLVAPVLQDHATERSVYLPKGHPWYDFWTGGMTRGGQRVNKKTPMDTIPIYVKAGTILPWGPDVQYAMEKPWDDLEVRVYPGADGQFTLYEDEGDNYNYENGAFTEIPFEWDNATNTLTIGARTGRYSGMLKHRTFRIIVVGGGKGTGDGLSAVADTTVLYDGTRQELILHVAYEHPEDGMTDVTDKIENPSFEADARPLTKVAPQGWTVDSPTAWWGVNQSDNPASGADPLATDGKYIFGVWDGSNTLSSSIHQTLTNLERGSYLLTVDMHASNRGATVRVGGQRLYANDDVAYFKDQVADPGNNDAWPMQTLRLRFEVRADGAPVTIGVATSDAPAETWFKIDNFRLYRQQSVTSVSPPTLSHADHEAVYTLGGIRLQTLPSKGVYIKGGKKILR